MFSLPWTSLLSPTETICPDYFILTDLITLTIFTERYIGDNFIVLLYLRCGMEITQWLLQISLVLTVRTLNFVHRVCDRVLYKSKNKQKFFP
jgi:hypothetical protein